jgi:AcrR family transcriptional regulator
MNDPFLKKEPRQSRSRALVAAVLEAMDTLLERGTTEQPSLHQIAKRAGVGVGSVYDYFSDASALWGALVRRLTQANFEALQSRLESTSDEPLGKTVGDMVDGTLATYLGTPIRTRAIISAIFRLELGRYVVEERDRFASLLSQRVLRDFPTADPTQVHRELRLMADFMMGVVMGELWRAEDAVEREAIRVALREIVVARVLSLKPN